MALLTRALQPWNDKKNTKHRRLALGSAMQRGPR